jgi:hypothetical protein
MKLPLKTTAEHPAVHQPPSQLIRDLDGRIFRPKGPPHGRRNIIFVAASGGGTRAALYTASVCEGLTRLKALDDVVLYSGVSGGSAAIAYLQLHRDELVTKNSRAQWGQFYETMSAPFIDDVLRGMLPVSVTLSPPIPSDLPGKRPAKSEKSVTISGETAARMIRAMHQPDEFSGLFVNSTESKDKLGLVWGWVMADPHTTVWHDLEIELRPVKTAGE